MRTSARALGVSIALASVLATPARALAFCRTSTGGLRAGCTIGGDECCTVGKPLFWKSACVGYSVQKDSSRQVSFDDVSQLLTTAFTQWTGASCVTGGVGQSRVSIDVRDLGPVACSVVEYNKTGPNQNVITFRDDHWNHTDGDNTLGLTTVTFDPKTGEIFDADMEINTASIRVTVADPVSPDGFDFASILTHEAGHFLGLAHATDAHATMFAHYRQGSTAMRNLASDDVLGACSIYQPDGTRTLEGGATVPQGVCDPTPRRGYTQACKGQTTTCATSFALGGEPKGHGHASLVASLGFFALVLARRRLRQRTSA